METFEIMKVISAKELERLRQQQVKEYNPETRVYANLEDEMNSILNDERIPKDVRARLVQHAQFRMNEVKNGVQQHAIQGLKRHLPTSEPVTPTPTHDADPSVAVPEEKVGVADAAPPPAYDRTFILGTVNKNYTKHADQLLKLLDRNSQVVTFNDKMQLVLHGRPVEGTNSVDLVNALFTAAKNRRPAGIEQFMRALGSINVPETYVPNTSITPLMYSSLESHSSSKKSKQPRSKSRSHSQAKKSKTRTNSQSGNGKRPPGKSPQLLYVYRK